MTLFWRKLAKMSIKRAINVFHVRYNLEKAEFGKIASSQSVTMR